MSHCRKSVIFPVHRKKSLHGTSLTIAHQPHRRCFHSYETASRTAPAVFIIITPRPYFSAGLINSHSLTACQCDLFNFLIIAPDVRKSLTVTYLDRARTSDSAYHPRPLPKLLRYGVYYTLLWRLKSSISTVTAWRL